MKFVLGNIIAIGLLVYIALMLAELNIGKTKEIEELKTETANIELMRQEVANLYARTQAVQEIASHTYDRINQYEGKIQKLIEHHDPQIEWQTE